jgi:hypothetical protein
LRCLLATALAAVTAPVVAAATSRSQNAASPAGGGPHTHPHTHPHRHRHHQGAPGAPGRAAEAVFDEVYRGRRIRGFRSRTRVAVTGAGTDWHVTLDDQPLHLMRRADGSYLSMIDHYGSYPTPREAARAAVDQLQPGERPSGLAHGSTGGTAVPPTGEGPLGGGRTDGSPVGGRPVEGGPVEGRGHGVHA